MKTKPISSKVQTCAVLLSLLATHVGCGDDDTTSSLSDAGGNDGGLVGSDGGAPPLVLLDGGGALGGDASPPAPMLDGGLPALPDGGQPDAASPAALVADAWAYTSEKRLLGFERASGRVAIARSISGLAEGEQIVGIDVRPADGTLFALGSKGRLYVVDPQTGVATLKSTLAADVSDLSEPYSALSGSVFGVDFNPVADRLRIVSDLGQNLRVNVDSGATLSDAALSPTSPGLTAAAYTDSFASACRTRLLVVDATARKLLLQSPPNDGKLMELAPLGGVVFSALRSFDISSGSDGAQRALVAGTTAAGEQLADLDLATGALSNPRTLALAAGERLEGIALPTPSSAPTQPAGELIATTAGNRLVSFQRSAPGKLCTAVAISGLAAGESIVGADVRPLDGALYGLSNLGKLYTLAVESGVATLRSTLAADPADSSEPYTSLTGEQFAIAFNPLPDRLRVISDGGLNLRINVDSGATTSDLTVSPATASLTAAAYTNAFAGAKSTALYALDSAADALVRVGGEPATGGACPEPSNPNCGLVTSLGLLGLGEVDAVNGFDIDGVSGTALAALSVGGAPNATLYAIDLSSGAAALPAGVANGTIAGGERLRSLSFAAAPKLTAWAISADQRLLSFAPATPATLKTDLPISGLSAGDTLLGLDLRPLDGKLYAVGSSGTLYSVNGSTGAANAVASLSAAMGSSYTALPAGDYGFDFNPSADALRLVARDGQNFRLLPSARAAGLAGATFVDSPLSPLAAGVAAAYTRNFAGSAGTTLFVIDGAAGTLFRQGGVAGTPSPNGGELTAIGALGVVDGGNVGFDIVGGHDGLALAALSMDGAPTALYSVNLATGTASPYNSAGNSLPESAARPLRGLALELR